MSTTAPSRSTTRSFGARAASKSKPYWNPEHPPPETLTRRAVPEGSAASRRAIRRAARSDKVTATGRVSITLDTRGKALSFLVLTGTIVKSHSRSCQCRVALLHCSAPNYFDSPRLAQCARDSAAGNPTADRQRLAFVVAIGALRR